MDALRRVLSLSIAETAKERDEEEKESDPFDDKLPVAVPMGHAYPTPYGSPNPSFAHLPYQLPNLWPQHTPIAHVTPYLKTLCIPEKHRANLFVTPDELRSVHRAVHLHAARESLQKYAGELTLDALFSSQNLPDGVTDSEKNVV